MYCTVRSADSRETTKVGRNKHRQGPPIDSVFKCQSHEAPGQQHRINHHTRVEYCKILYGPAPPSRPERPLLVPPRTCVADHFNAAEVERRRRISVAPQESGPGGGAGARLLAGSRLDQTQSDTGGCNFTLRAARDSP